MRHPPPRRAGRLDFEVVPKNLRPRRRWLPSLWSLGVLLVLVLIGGAIAVFVRGAWELLLGGRP